MTTPGATEAVTPEQRALAVCKDHKLYIDGHDGIARIMHSHKLHAAIVSAIREAEANALRRALYEVEYIERYEDSDRDVLLKYIANLIRSLLPKEAGKT